MSGRQLATRVGVVLTPVAVRPRVTAAGVTAVAAGLLALGVWLLHKPGIANQDGLWLYAQGIGKQSLADLQPVYIAVAVRGLSLFGLKFAHLTLLQSVLVCLGVQRLAAGVVKTAAGLPDRSAHLVGLLTLTLLLTPLTPLAWYLVYFGSDGCLQTVLLWFGVLWLGSHRRFPDAGRRERLLRLAGLTALAGAAVLVRPNAVALLPVFAGLLVALHGRRAAVWILVLLAVRPVAGAVVYGCFAVDRSPPGDPVMAHDLVGVAVLRPEALEHMPFTAAHLNGDQYRAGKFHAADPLYPWGEPANGPDGRPRFTFGNVDPLFPWGFEPIVKPGFAVGAHEPLAAEFWATARRYPGTLALVKLRGFLNHLLDPAPYWHNTDLDPNTLGLFHRPNRPLLRSFHLAIDHQVWDDPVLRWVSCRHVVWLTATAFAVVALAYGWYRRPSRAAAALGLLLLVPLAYYLTFLFGMNGNHFRFMYPATLVAQVVLVALLVNVIRLACRTVADRLAE